MPYQWIEPELFFKIGSWNVLHAYKGDNVLVYWYSMYDDSGELLMFDIRDVLPFLSQAQRETIADVPDVPENLRDTHKLILSMVYLAARNQGISVADFLREVLDDYED